MNRNKIKTILLPVFLIVAISSLYAQPLQEDYNDLFLYRVCFNDKGAGPEAWSPEELLSPAAIARRDKLGIPCPDEKDIPVSREHIATLTGLGLSFRCASKWMNSALFSSVKEADTDELEGLWFIDRVQLVKLPSAPVKSEDSKYGVAVPGDDPDAFDPRLPHNGHLLHQSGFNGRNVVIAVLDAGFLNADLIESLGPLRNRGGIIATRDFIRGTDYVYDYHTHGTSVLSILAGNLPGIINGTAPGAGYLLLRSEDDETEYPVEEDYWTAAAEYADSAGADIISSSLGYFTFDDPSMNYSFGDMDGNTAFITRAANIAASKGILVVNSAGNERNKEWVRIIAPSDGDNVVGVGAVRHDLTISDFSSSGYSSGGQVKPDVVAPGVLLPMQFDPGLWHQGSGTSFSCPVISGLCASLMQAVQASSPAEITQALHLSSDRYSNPDSLYGYGLPDFLQALRYLEEMNNFRPEVMITAGPNPFLDAINLWFRDPPGHLTVTITSTAGTRVWKRSWPAFVARSCKIDGLGHMSQGIYYVKVITDQGEKVFKMSRIAR
ncbi:MAG: S8 family peptidase [Bacteroidales bacterium]